MFAALIQTFASAAMPVVHAYAAIDAEGGGLFTEPCPTIQEQPVRPSRAVNSAYRNKRAATLHL